MPALWTLQVHSFHTHTHTHTHMHAYTHICMHTHTHTHKHTCMHTHTNTIWGPQTDGVISGYYLPTIIHSTFVLLSTITPSCSQRAQQHCGHCVGRALQVKKHTFWRLQLVFDRLLCCRWPHLLVLGTSGAVTLPNIRGFNPSKHQGL